MARATPMPDEHTVRLEFDAPHPEMMVKLAT